MAATREEYFSVIFVIVVATEISARSNLLQNKNVKFLVDGNNVEVEDGWDASSKYEVRRNAVTCLEESLGLFCTQYSCGYPVGCLRVLRTLVGGGDALLCISRVPGDIGVPSVEGVLFEWYLL